MRHENRDDVLRLLTRVGTIPPVRSRVDGPANQ
jgi:hypothetical protein